MQLPILFRRQLEGDRSVSCCNLKQKQSGLMEEPTQLRQSCTDERGAKPKFYTSGYGLFGASSAACCQELTVRQRKGIPMQTYSLNSARLTVLSLFALLSVPAGAAASGLKRGSDAKSHVHDEPKTDPADVQ